MSNKKARQIARSNTLREAKIPRHRIGTTDALHALLEMYAGKKIYVDYNGTVVIHSQGKEAARIELVGI